jgi:tRNA (guanine37-N1)-methyltransferase
VTSIPENASFCDCGSDQVAREPGSALRIAIVTLFPELFESFLGVSFVGRARRDGMLQVHLEHLREHGLGTHRAVDDTPYGGGPGMVMRVDCVVASMESAEATCEFRPKGHRILLTPQGRRFTQQRAVHWVELNNLVFVCGRYEGFDERIRAFVDEESSLGDFILMGGEIPAMAAVEACTRLVDGVLGNNASARDESFSTARSGMLEYPQYTRPVTFRGHEVPEVLRSGDHAKIHAWRDVESRARTRERRPDLCTDDSIGDGR